MLRRQAIGVLLGAVARAGVVASLDRFFDAPGGAALLVEVRTRRLIAVSGPNVVARSLTPPGSTLKPFVLAALLKSGRLDAGFSLPCPGRLRIGGRTLDCSHPPLDVPVRIDTAIAYSCNCFVAEVARRFAPGELARVLESYGFASPSGLMPEEAAGRVRAERSVDGQRLQALGEGGILVTVAELAMAYRLLAVQRERIEMRPVLIGLEGAVEFGTAQHARVDGTKLAGKTGSMIADTGEPVAWFAGFFPGRAPEAAIAVMLPGRSGGADAAPVAGRILAAYHAGRL